MTTILGQRFSFCASEVTLQKWMGDNLEILFFVWHLGYSPVYDVGSVGSLFHLLAKFVPFSLGEDLVLKRLKLLRFVPSARVFGTSIHSLKLTASLHLKLGL